MMGANLLGEGQKFLLSSRSGAYYTNGLYGLGFCVTRGSILNILHRFDGAPIRAIEDCFTSVEVRRDDTREDWFVPFGRDALIMQSSPKTRGRWLFDVRRVGDGRSWGRFYDVTQRGHRLMITFTKKTHHLEDVGEGEIEYSIVIGMSVDGMIEKTAGWCEEGGRYVFDACSTEAGRVILAVGSTPGEVDGILDELERSAPALRKLHADYLLKTHVPSPDVDAYLAAAQGLDALLNALSSPALCFPLQDNAFDRLAAAAALTSEREYRHALDIILRERQGNTESRLWWALRLNQLLKALGREGLLEDYLTREQLEAIRRDAIAIDSFASPPFSVEGKSDIVVQCLVLNLLDLLGQLTGDATYKRRALAGVLTVRNLYVKAGVLHFTPEGQSTDDGFLAWYIYSPLLSDRDWATIFTKLLERSFGSADTDLCVEPWKNFVAGIALSSVHRHFFHPFVDKLYERGVREFLGGLCRGQLASERGLSGRSNASFIEFCHALAHGPRQI